MHSKKLTCVILLQLQVLHGHVIRSLKGGKNLQEYGIYTNDTNHDQILNIAFSLSVFILHNLKLWLHYKSKIKPGILAFKNCWMSQTQFKNSQVYKKGSRAELSQAQPQALISRPALRASSAHLLCNLSVPFLIC